jgi:hypothetical protein
MLESPAYRALSRSAHRVLSPLEIELAHHGGNDNGRLPTTYDHFVEYGIDRESIAPAIREVVALGFVEVTEQGRAGNAEHRRPNLFRLTFRSTDKANATDDWQKIETREEANLLASAARKSGQGNRAFRGAHKLIPSPDSPHVSDRKIPTETAFVPVGETPTTVHGRKTPTTSISRVRGRSSEPSNPYRSHKGVLAQIEQRLKLGSAPISSNEQYELQQTLDIILAEPALDRAARSWAEKLSAKMC